MNYKTDKKRQELTDFLTLNSPRLFWFEVSDGIREMFWESVSAHLSMCSVTELKSLKKQVIKHCKGK